MSRPSEDAMNLDHLFRAIDQIGTLVARVRPEQAADPTPCASWNVHDLVNHVVDETYRFAESTATGSRGPSDGDHLTGDWVSAFDQAAESLRAAWQSPGAVDRVHRFPGGEVPAAWAIGQQATEFAIHAWDIAKATGQSTDLDPELGELAMDWARQNMVPQIRGDESGGFHIAQAVTVSEDASLYDRLAAFGGRQP
ncbi:TIGR03086 family protein [Nocardia huaxiensis]|uniref:TIGR03086 family protein n=1 Tax=Nocardia huaxiensis TaxID=2755382 RepID=A0A7D6YYY7_9NOCA|nr:TIGR03086 family metal-binding protein [Nocardia huaxiensis]QLY27846.1 TIGR03086 family protein [Nocardia huaxiensis]